MRVKTWSRGLVVAISLGVVLFAVTAYAAVTVILAVGTIPHSELFDGPATVTVRTLTIKPGEVLAWHYHPGPAYNVVKSGTLTVEDGCGGDETFTPGQAFAETNGRIHRAKNLSTTDDVVVYNTFIVPAGQPTTLNIPNNQRLCGPPANVGECKNGNWMNFTHPHTFGSEGDCILYLRNDARTFVRQQYLDFLLREPDQAGWDFWTGRIKGCGFDTNCIDSRRTDVSLAFFYSAEFQAQPRAANLRNPTPPPDFNNREFVRLCYLAYLQREPDQGGWDFWTNILNRDGSYKAILSAFINSSEYRQRISP